MSAANSDGENANHSMGSTTLNRLSKANFVGLVPSLAICFYLNYILLLASGVGSSSVDYTCTYLLDIFVLGDSENLLPNKHCIIFI